MDKDRENWVRNRERRRVRVRVWDDHGLDTSGFTVDISPSGVFIESVKEVVVGAQLHMELDAHGRSFFTEGVVARVRRVHRGAKAVIRPGFGVRFVGALEALTSQGAAPADTLLEADLRDPETLSQVYERDLKLGVLTLRTSRPPALGAPVRVRLRLPAPQRDVLISGVVEAHLPEMPGVGVALEEPSPVQRLVQELLAFR